MEEERIQALATVLIRNLSDETRQVLEARAERHPRSLEAELRAILDAAARPEAGRLDGPAFGEGLAWATRPNPGRSAEGEALGSTPDRPLLPANL